MFSILSVAVDAVQDILQKSVENHERTEVSVTTESFRLLHSSIVSHRVLNVFPLNLFLKQTRHILDFFFPIT